MRFDFLHTLPIGDVSVIAEYFESQTDGGERFAEAAEIHCVEFLDGREYAPTAEERAELELAAIGWANYSPEDLEREDYDDGWNDAINAAIELLPGGDSCDPQQIADDIRELLTKERDDLD